MKLNVFVLKCVRGVGFLFPSVCAWCLFRDSGSWCVRPCWSWCPLCPLPFTGESSVDSLRPPWTIQSQACGQAASQRWLIAELRLRSIAHHEHCSSSRYARCTRWTVAVALCSVVCTTVHARYSCWNLQLLLLLQLLQLLPAHASSLYRSSLPHSLSITSLQHNTCNS